jgi:hypothetical protein
MRCRRAIRWVIRHRKIRRRGSRRRGTRRRGRRRRGITGRRALRLCYSAHSAVGQQERGKVCHARGLRMLCRVNEGLARQLRIHLLTEDFDAGQVPPLNGGFQRLGVIPHVAMRKGNLQAALLPAMAARCAASTFSNMSSCMLAMKHEVPAHPSTRSICHVTQRNVCVCVCV